MGLNAYATLQAFRTRQGLAVADTGDDARMLSKLRAASDQMNRFVGREFYPSVATRKFDCPDGDTLLLRGSDLLSVTTLTNGDARTIPSTDYILLGDDTPYYGIMVDPSLNYYTYLTTKIKAITVLGIFGCHNDYANAWRDTLQDIPGGGITSSAITMTLTDVDGTDSWGLTDALQVGQLIKVESEFMQVVARNISTNLLTVVRGANGSTAATHAAGVDIYAYVPTGDIAEICLRWAAWLYKMEDAGDYSGETTEVGLGSTQVPGGLPRDLMAALSNYRRVGSI